MLISVQAFSISRSAASLYHDVSSKIFLYIMNRRNQDLNVHFKSDYLFWKINSLLHTETLRMQ